ncbi:prepilin-type N-terminal cleavage/methylation domain-containing protein [bacterium]|nr:prepilin-type N-terminal cleavage/methylation domain-containing protein [bacterium]
MKRRASHFSRGFTVLEILIAVTIFAILSLVIFALFRTAVQAQESADRETRRIQQARFAMDTIGKDIDNIFYRDETSYNVAITKLIEEMEAARLEAEQNNDWEAFYATYGDPNKDDDEQDPSIGDPFKKGRIIDLQMQGSADTLSFAVQTPFQIGGYYRAWGLARVEYTLRDRVLVRTARTVETDERNQLGERTSTVRIPEVAKLADGVESIEFGYSFWWDNQWYEVDQWDSANRQIRNPRYFLGTYDADTITLAQSDENREQRDNDNATFGPGSPGFNDSLNDSKSEPLDRLPQMIRIRIKLGDPNGKGRIQTFESIHRVPTAQETWTPLPELNEDVREDEQKLRDDEYTPVYPGATRPPR